MSATENKAFVRRYLEAINGKEKPAAVVDQFISDEDAALKQHIAGYEAAFPRYVLAPDEIMADGDKVVVRFTFRATYGGGMTGIPATGQKVAMPGIIIYRLAGGKIVEHWMHVDSETLMKQLGAKA